MKKSDFPKGTIFSGELAFVPIPKDEGGGFKTVNLNTGKEYDSFGDSVFEDKNTLPDIMANPAKKTNDAEKNLDESMTYSTGKIDFEVDYEKLFAKNDKVLPGDDENDNISSDKNSRDENGSLKDGKIGNDVKDENEVKKKAKKSKDEIYKNIHKGHRERMKKRFKEFGLENFSEHEVLEFLLYFTHPRCDTNPIAHALIDEFGDITRVFKTDMFDLKSVDGIGEESALLISFCRQLITYLNANIKEKVCLSDATEAGLFCCKYFMQHTEESFIAIMLDSKRCVQKVVVISKGTENETAYYPRNVIKATIKHKANMVLIAHNHTGNSVHPSNNDIVLSNEINKLLEGIGIPLVDHIICCGNLFTSLMERELIK